MSIELTEATTAPELVADFDRAALGVTGESNPLLLAKREAAYAAYERLPMPTARGEDEWRRTDPETIPYELLRGLAPLSTRPAGEPRKHDEEFDAVVEITSDGFSVTDKSGALAEGRLEVASLSDAAQKSPELIERYLGGGAHFKGERKFAAFADAFWNVGFFVRIPRGTVLPKGVLLRYKLESEGAAVPRVLVVAESGSEATVTEHFISPDGLPLLCVSSLEAYVGAGAHLTTVALQEWGDATSHVGEDWARLEDDASIHWITLHLGGKLGKMIVGCDCAKPNSNAFLSGLVFADGERHIDQRTLQQHSSPQTESNLLYKVAVKDTGRSIYQGVIAASKGAIKVDAYQMNHNLVLNDKARADSLPGLEIDADDLKCSHGSTVGSLDAEQIYYLRTRGFTEVAARQILVEGFFENVVSRVPHAFIQEHVRAQLAEKMR